MDQTKRTGRATSSQFYRVADGVKVDKPTQVFTSYVDEVVCEKISKRPVTVEVKTREMSWGSLMEILVSEHIVEDHVMSLKDTVVSKIIPEYWSGTPDIIYEDRIGEIKCPQPKAFAQLVRAMYRNDLAYLKKNYKKYYWQCVSNSILCEKKKAELILFMPYKAELEKVIDLCNTTDYLKDHDLKISDYYFLNEGVEKLPYLPEDSLITNFNSFTFEVPQEDIEFAKKRISLFAEQVDAEYKMTLEQIRNA